VEEDNQLGFEFPGLGRRKIEANFAGGQVSSDGGVMLLRQVDRWLGFTKQLDRILPDRRNPLLIQHSQESLLRQRIYALALGYTKTLTITPPYATICSGRRPRIGP
jgi:Transposase DDE domain group 1